jgi:hypothetical protein
MMGRLKHGAERRKLPPLVRALYLKPICAANNGVTVHQLMAIFGWDTIKEAEKYTAKETRLAESAMHLLDARWQE